MGVIKRIAGAASAAASRGDVPAGLNDGGAVRTGKSASKSDEPESTQGNKSKPN